MDHAADRRRTEAAHRPPARPLRGGVAAPGPPPPLKVYCVEPRDFRELVQRLTGAGTAPPRATNTPAAAVPRDNARVEAATAVPEQLDYASWFSAPLLISPAYAPDGFDGGHHGNGGFVTVGPYEL